MPVGELLLRGVLLHFQKCQQFLNLPVIISFKKQSFFKEFLSRDVTRALPQLCGWFWRSLDFVSLFWSNLLEHQLLGRWKVFWKFGFSVVVPLVCPLPRILRRVDEISYKDWFLRGVSTRRQVHPDSQWKCAWVVDCRMTSLTPIVRVLEVHAAHGGWCQDWFSFLLWLIINSVCAFYSVVFRDISFSFMIINVWRYIIFNFN